jgi:ComF family protein
MILYRTCLGCHQKGQSLLCDTCLEYLFLTQYPTQPSCMICRALRASQELCSRCQRQPLKIKKLFIAGYYTGPRKQLIHYLKYREPLPSSQLKILVDPLVFDLEHNANLEFPVLIVPIPLHPIKHFWRGYNQASIVGKYIHRHFKHLGCDYTDYWVIRSKWTRKQTQLAKSDRLSNTKEAFKLLKIPCITPNINRYKTIIIVDDVFTTGSTLNAMAQLIHKSYPEAKILGACVARSGVLK